MVKNNTWFVSRHSGSIEWIKSQNIPIDYFIEHLDEKLNITQGDTVIGSLPVQTISMLNKRGVKFIHLVLDLPQALRGIELTAKQVHELKPSLNEYIVWQCDKVITNNSNC